MGKLFPHTKTRIPASLHKKAIPRPLRQAKSEGDCCSKFTSMSRSQYKQAGKNDQSQYINNNSKSSSNNHDDGDNDPGYFTFTEKSFMSSLVQMP